MNKQRVAQILTVVILAAALAVTLLRKNTRQTSEATPQDSVYAMLDAAREGDVKKYLASYAGAMETSLRQSIAESSEVAFRKYLQESNAALKGVAVMAPESVSDAQVKVRVEYVYQDRNEAQTMILEKTGTGWRISRVDSAERVKTLVPYGTPVQ